MIKVLWVTNTLFPEALEKLGLPQSVVGGWMASSAQSLLEYSSDLKIGVASFSSACNELTIIEHERLVHYIIPSVKYAEARDGHESTVWNEIAAHFIPDLIHIHGSEYPQSNSCAKTLTNHQITVSIQGLISEYKDVYYGGLSRLEILKNITIRDLARRDSLISQKANMSNRAKHEMSLVRHVDSVIGRTCWDKSCSYFLNPKATYHYCNETLRQGFYKKRWHYDQCHKYSIFVSQGHYPIKGLHIFIDAIALLKDEFPEIKVTIAGTNPFKSSPYRRMGYAKFINKKIKTNQLVDHLQFVGLLNEKQVIDALLTSHISVCPSAIENSPNSVGESQILSVPCIASFVGGMGSIIEHERTGILYPFNDVKALAYSIKKLFTSKKLCESLSKESRIKAHERHDPTKNAECLLNIYNRIINQHSQPS